MSLFGFDTPDPRTVTPAGQPKTTGLAAEETAPPSTPTRPERTEPPDLPTEDIVDAPQRLAQSEEDNEESQVPDGDLPVTGGITDEEIAALAHKLDPTQEIDASTIQAYQVPEEEYRFDPAKQAQSSTDLLTRLNEYTVFEEVAKTLTPQKELTQELHKIRGSMQACSLAVDSSVKSLAKVIGNPKFIHKTVKVSTKLVIPHRSPDYTDIFTIYQNIDHGLQAYTTCFQKNATSLITQSQRVEKFHNRLDRVKLLTTPLIHQVAVFHVDYYNLEHSAEDPTPTDQQPIRPIELAYTAVYKLFGSFDLELLEYLDINRTALEQFFITLYQPAAYTEHTTFDKKAIDYALEQMLSYIKVITCIHYNSKKATILQKTSAATVAARMNARQAETAMSILNECLASQAASVPKNDKTLKDTVLQIVDDREASQEANAAKKRSRSPKSHQPTAKGTAGRPPAKQTPNARSSQIRGRNNATTQGSA